MWGIGLSGGQHARTPRILSKVHDEVYGTVDKVFGVEGLGLGLGI